MRRTTLLIDQPLPRPPKELRGPIPLDDHGRPRFCGTIYVDILQGHLAESTRALSVDAIQQLHQTAALQSPPIDVDAALLDGRMEELEALLASHLIRLRSHSRPGSVAAQRTWRRVLNFVGAILTHAGADAGREVLRAKLLRLERLYAQLSPTRVRGPSAIRALPAVAVEELYEIFSPEAERNPYRTESVRWRNFAIFLLLLHLGLRAGELLSLRVASARSEYDPQVGQVRFWLDVVDCDDPGDRRVRRPRLKTAASTRQLPLSEELAELIDLYVVNFRGDRDHGLLFSSAEGAPLAVTSLASAIHSAASCLTSSAKQALIARGQKSVTPHDLRHTSAVVRLQRYREAGVSQDEALERLRPFFGWVPGSDMPLHYARAYFEPRFQDTWDESFSTALHALRAAAGNDHAA